MQRPGGMPDFSSYVMQAQASASPLVVNLPTTALGREYVLHLSHNVMDGERRGVVLTLVDNTELARAERHTRSTEQRLLAVLTHGSALVAIKDAAGRYEFANPRYARYLGMESSRLLGRTDAQCLAAGLAAQLRKGDIEVLQAGATLEREETFSVDGERRVWWAARFPIHDEDGAIVSVCLQAIDLTEARAADDELRIAAKVFDTTTEGVMITDPEHRILRVNDAFTLITGFTADEVRGRSPRIIASGRHNEDFYRSMWEEIDRTGGWQGEIWNKRKNGEIYPEWLSINTLHDAAGRVTHYVGVFTDVTTLTEAREHMRRMATHDLLTGLPNRTLLQDRLAHAVDTSRRHGAELAVCFVDLDNFKTVNDSLGHEAGDEMLRLAAKRICDSVRSVDTVARIGGDEFVLLLENTSRHECLQTVERITRALAENVDLRGSLITTAASLGVAMFPGDGADAAALMRNADAAMYRAKRAGRSRYEFFSAEVGESARNRLAVESGLRQALQAGELHLEYQPQIDVASGELRGFEALLRWRTQDGASIEPSVFLPIAEETALIDLIGDWVLGAACAQLAQWRSGSLPGYSADLCLSVNVSARQLRDRQFAEKLQHHLVTHRVAGRQLVLEVTESALVQQSEQLSQLMRRLDQLGVQLSLDDFGTGFSSLAVLRQLPLDELKIDRSFIAGMTDQRDDREIVEAIVGLARALGLRVVAEGVETAQQLGLLAASGHHMLAQGFLFTPALPPAELQGWLSAHLVDGKRLSLAP
jgi:two-component system CheB/CheR fusion protein